MFKIREFVGKLSILFGTFGLYNVDSMIYITDGLTIDKVMIMFRDGSNKSVDIRTNDFEAILNDILKALKEEY